MRWSLRVPAALAAAVTALSLASCGGDDETATPDATVKTFLMAVGRGDAETACSLIDTDAGADFPFFTALGVTYDGDCIVEVNDFGDSYSEKIAATFDQTSFDVAQSDGETIVSDVNLDATNPVALDFVLEEADDGWKIVEVREASR